MSEEPVHFEKRDAHPRAVLIFLGATALAVVLAAIGITFFMRELGTHPRSPVKAENVVTYQEADAADGPRLQANPQADLTTYRAREDALLNGYGWVDRGQGTVRIPIEEAMKLTVERGLPPGNAWPNGATPLEMRSQKAGGPTSP